MRRRKFEFCVWIRELKNILARCRAALAPKWCNISPQLLVRGHTQHVGRHALRRAQRYGPLFNYFLFVFSRVSKPECSLAGIDLYDGEGTKIAEGGARSMKIMANPADINVLPGCSACSILHCLICGVIASTDTRMIPERSISCSTVSIARAMICTCGLRPSQGMLLNRKSYIPKPKPLSIPPPPCSGRHHFVYIDLGHVTTLSLIRFFAQTPCVE